MGHGGLLFHGSGNLLVLVDDHAHRAKNILQRLLDLLRLAHRAIGHLMADAHGLHRRADATVQLGDHLLDFFGRLLGTLGQRAHFICDHGKAAPLLAGSRGFDRRIER